MLYSIKHLMSSPHRLNLASQILRQHTLARLYLVLEGRPPASIPGPNHVTHSPLSPPLPSLGNGPAGYRGVGPARGAPVGVSFKSHLPWLPERAFSPP